MSILDVAKNFAREVKVWVKNGAPVVPQAEFEKRAHQCAACEFFDADAFMGRGKCNKCGCSSFKLFLSTSKCPDGRWDIYEEKVDRKNSSEVEALLRRWLLAWASG